MTFRYQGRDIYKDLEQKANEKIFNDIHSVQQTLEALTRLTRPICLVQHDNILKKNNKEREKSENKVTNSDANDIELFFQSCLIITQSVILLICSLIFEYKIKK